MISCDGARIMSVRSYCFLGIIEELYIEGDLFITIVRGTTVVAELA